MGEKFFEIKTPVFEGPLHLLLDLIEKRKLHISDVSLAGVTDDYMAFLERERTTPISERADFIVVASTLLLIKSKSLLPNLELSPEESESIEDLETRLRLLKRIREQGGVLAREWGRRHIFAGAPSEEFSSPLFTPPPEISLKGLAGALAGVLRELPKGDFIPEAIVEKVMSLEEMILTLTERVRGALSLSFREFSGLGKKNKVEVIVGFLALLELAKRGIIEVRQDALFADICMESGTPDIPRYGPRT